MRQRLPKFNELVEDLDSVLQRLYKAALTRPPDLRST
jgi:hypothetical protein